MSQIAEPGGEGWEIPPFWPDPGKDVPHPLGTFRQPISIGDPAAEKLPGAYALTIDPGPEVDDFSRYAERAKERGWPCRVWRTGHNPQRTMPIEYAGLPMGIQ